MIKILALLEVEFTKLKRSLALLLCVAAPVFVGLLTLLGALNADEPQSWDMVFLSGTAMWAYFMLPMSATALTILVAQIEHGPRAWNAVLSLPIPRWCIYAAKASVVTTLIGAMSLVLWMLLFVSGTLAELIRPGDHITGSPDLAAAALLISKMFVGSLFLIVIQLWAALFFRSFVPPLVIGIGGTFVAVVATSSKWGAWFPWLIAVQALGTDTGKGALAIAFGFLGGLAALVAMLYTLNSRETI